MVSGATCSGSPVGAGSCVGSCVGGGPAGADDGGGEDGVVGATEVRGGEVGVAVVVGPDVVLGLALALGLGAAELVVGPGDGVPEQPVRTSSPLRPRTLSAESLGLVMMPPWMWVPRPWDPHPSYARGLLQNRD